MVGRILVVTALEKAFPRNSEPVMLLGEWCNIYSKNKDLDWINSRVAPYHWDDRKKLHQDYIYLKDIYEKLLGDVSSYLNKIHGMEYSVRYWRILVGPWLGYFTQIVFDRWEMLRRFRNDTDILYVKLTQHSDNEFIPNGMEDFNNFILTDEWNDYLYGKITNWMEMPVEINNSLKPIVENKKNSKSYSIYKQINLRLRSVLNYVFGILGSDNSYFFISTYLGVKRNIKLQIKLKQIPQLWQRVTAPKAEVSAQLRDRKLPEFEGEEFEKLIRMLIPKNIPRLYLEGYPSMLKQSNDLPWPKFPKAIFTSNSLWSDDVFKIWAAERAEKGVPLVIGQHGGNYGMASWSFSEDHEIAISDRYLTWGWKNRSLAKVIQIGNFKKLAKAEVDWSGGALLVETTVPRQSYQMFSAPVGAGQWQGYFQEQIRFVRALNEDLRDKILVRLSFQDYEHCQQQRWKDELPNIKLNYGKDSIVNLMKRSRIYISTYNATTYLESLLLNFPTIIFWNPAHWELREEAATMLEKLTKVGIFHITPESAAKKLTDVWSDVAGWWFDQEVQLIRAEFCDCYSRAPDKTIPLLVNTLREV